MAEITTPQPIITQMPSTAGIPGLNQAPVSPVAQTNPLMSLQQGGVEGFSLGLAARQQAALEQQRQIEIMAAQQQAKIAQQKALMDAATMTHQNFEDLTKVDPDHAVDYYNQAIAPLHQAILSQYGVHMDASQMPASHQNADAIDKINSYVDMLKDPSKAPLALQGLNRISNQMDIAQQTREKAAAGMKTVGEIQDYSKHQDELMSQEFQRRQQLRSDPLIQQVELKQSAAGAVYDQLKRAQKSDGTYDISVPQLVDLYGNLYRAQTGVGITGEALPMMDQKTAQGNYAKLAGYFGLSKNALPKEMGDRLLHMSDQLGSFNELQHSKLLEGRDVQMPGISPVNQEVIKSWPNARGMTFSEMKASSEKASKFQPGLVTIVDSTGKQHQIFEKNLDAAKKRDPGLKVMK